MLDHFLHVVESLLLLCFTLLESIFVGGDNAEKLWDEAIVEEAFELGGAHFLHAEVFDYDRECIQAENLVDGQIVRDLVLERTGDVYQAPEISQFLPLIILLILLFMLNGDRFVDELQNEGVDLGRDGED